MAWDCEPKLEADLGLPMDSARREPRAATAAAAALAVGLLRGDVPPAPRLGLMLPDVLMRKSIAAVQNKAGRPRQSRARGQQAPQFDGIKHLAVPGK